MDVVFYTKVDTMHFKEEKRKFIDHFQDICFKKPIDMKCDTAGMVIFKDHDKQVLSGYFSHWNTSTDPNGQCFQYTLDKKNYTVRLDKTTVEYLNLVWETVALKKD